MPRAGGHPSAVHKTQRKGLGDNICQTPIAVAAGAVRVESLALGAGLRSTPRRLWRRPTMSSPPPNERELRDRLDTLERSVAAIHERLDAIDGHSAPAPKKQNNIEPASADKVRHVDPPASDYDPDRYSRSGRVAQSGEWLNRLGIALLLVGLAFGFKYSIDQGWFGPSFRVIAGALFGVALVAASSPMRSSRPGLARVLSGGGIVLEYLTVYAAFQLYGLVSHAAAFVAMGLVTIAAFTLALREKESVMATLASIGGLATPFLLLNDNSTTLGLVGYTSILLAGSSAVYWYRAWAPLLWTSALGGWMVFGFATLNTGSSSGNEPLAIALGTLVLALATWVLPVFRLQGLDQGEDETSAESWPAWALQAHQLALATPVAALALHAELWDLSKDGAGVLALALACLWALSAGLLLWRRSLRKVDLAHTHLTSSAVLIAFAAGTLLGDQTRMLVLAADGLSLLWLASRSGNAWPALGGHTFMLLAAFQCAQQLLGFERAPLPFSFPILSCLAVILALAGAARMQSGQLRGAYAALAQFALLVWFARFFEGTRSMVVLTFAWFANAVALIVLGLRRGSFTLRRGGEIVMALTVAKLFLLDLAVVHPGLRVLTFVVFGLVLLAVSYAFPQMFQSDPGSEGSS